MFSDYFLDHLKLNNFVSFEKLIKWLYRLGSVERRRSSGAFRVSHFRLRSLSQPAATRRAETGFYRVDAANHAVTPIVCRPGPLTMVQMPNFAQ